MTPATTAAIERPAKPQRKPPACPPPAPLPAPPAAAPEASAEARPRPQAATEEKPTPSRREPPRRVPPVALPDPRNADQLLALSRDAIEWITFEAQLRLAQAKRQQAAARKASEPDRAALTAINGELGYLGALLSALGARRTTMRVAARKAQGSVTDRAEAIAIAVDRLVDGRLHRRIHAEADKVQARAAADLAADVEPAPPHAGHPLLRSPHP